MWNQAKQKQRGAERMMLPSVEGQEEGKWIVIDSGIDDLYYVSYLLLLWWIGWLIWNSTKLRIMIV